MEPVSLTWVRWIEIHRTQFWHESMERIDWTFALSVAATLALAVCAISILLFAM